MPWAILASSLSTSCDRAVPLKLIQTKTILHKLQRPLASHLNSISLTLTLCKIQNVIADRSSTWPLCSLSVLQMSVQRTRQGAASHRYRHSSLCCFCIDVKCTVCETWTVSVSVVILWRCHVDVFSGVWTWCRIISVLQDRPGLDLNPPVPDQYFQPRT